MATPGTTKPKRPWPVELIEAATALTKKFGIYLAAVAATITALFTLWDQLGLWETYGVLGMVAFVGIIFMPFAIVVVTEAIPKWREHQRQQRLVREGVAGVVRPGYFRLQPYDERDHEHFVRADAAHETVRQWIILSEVPLLYLTGRSGTGKSSLLNAWVLPDWSYMLCVMKAPAAWVPAVRVTRSKAGLVRILVDGDRGSNRQS